jgi:hypothetical protein
MRPPAREPKEGPTLRKDRISGAAAVAPSNKKSFAELDA